MIKPLSVIFLFLVEFAAFAQSPDHRLFLIGDAGKLEAGQHPIVNLVKKMISEQNTVIKSDVLFLGDNIYPKGMPGLGNKNLKESQEILRQQVSLADDVDGSVWMIPGNHDWQKGRDGGWQAVLRAQAFVDSMYRKNLFWVPKDACPGPYVTDLGKEVVLLILDSQWWLQPDNKPGRDSDCEFKSETEILSAVEDVFIANKDKTVLLALHHPLKTYGEHNGAYGWKDHIFPLTAINSNLYIPLPLIGSIYPLYRTHLGNIQDVPHPKYQELIKGIDHIIMQHSRVLVLSGHEHALEYTIDEDKVHHIVSGAGAKSSMIKKHNPTKFAYENQGFAVLDFYSNSTVELNFYSLEKGLTPIYSHIVFEKKSRGQSDEKASPISFDSHKILPITERYHATPKQEKWYGANYRKEWGQAVKFRTFDISKEKGGLAIVKRGGGMQTRSLRLADKKGNEYVLRSVEKYPESAIPETLRKTIARDIVQDQISASHPYGALIIPQLAKAVHVYHTKPELVWLPDDPALGIYQNDFGGAVYLFEQREISPENLKDKDYKFYSTDKMLRKRLADQDFEVDQKKILRARLLDLFIGDWDRHDDQWRWIGIDTDKGREFVPVPRDRDQAFFVNEGILPKIASRKWIMPKFQGFDYELRDVNGFMFNGRYFDRSFLNDLDRKDWEEASNKFLEGMDDETIASAVKVLPKEVFQYHGDDMIAKLKYRKGWLKEQALKYYNFLSKEVDVYGTFKDELVEIDHEPDGKVDVEINKISKKGNIKQKIFNRKFDPEETQEIRIYGLGGNDEIQIKGSGPGNIKVRVMSGPNPDKITDKSNLKTRANLIYRWREQNDELSLGKSSRTIHSKSPDIYDYDRKAFQYDVLMPLASIEFNVDDGIFLGGGIQWTKHGFRKQPYALKQSIKGNIALKTGAENLYYQGHAVDLLGKLDLEWDATVRAPNYVNNFFGYGNERSEFLKEEYNAKYYRIRYNQINLNVWLRENFGKYMAIRFGPLLQRVKMDEDDNLGKYISSPDQIDIDIEELNKPKLYTGADFQFLVDKTDHSKIPNRGVKFLQQFTYYHGIDKTNQQLTSVLSELSLYWSRQIPSRITWATKFGGGVNWGDYEFFQAQSLGGQDNLRGYRRNRYLGHAMIYNNTEARIRFDDFTTRLFPATVGMTVFHDIGRVWFESEQSSKWHNSFGAGVWLAPMNAFVVSGTLAIGEEVLPTFTFGYQF